MMQHSFARFGSRSFVAAASLMLLAMLSSGEPCQAQIPSGLPVGLPSTAAITAQARNLQAQFERHVENQLRQRMYAEAQRAVRYARSGNSADRAIAARRRAFENVNARATAGAQAAERSRRVNANLPDSLERDSRLGPTSPPPGFTETDVQIYDHVFGKFNPLRSANAAIDIEELSSASNRSAQATEAWKKHIRAAASQRLAEISEMRDQALATSDVELLRRTQRMEVALDAYAKAALETPAVANQPTEFPPSGEAISR